MPIIAILLAVVVGAASAGGGGGGGGDAAAISSGGGGGGSGEWDSSLTVGEANVYRTAEYNADWGLEAIHAAEAYAILNKNDKAVGGDDVVVAITDTYIDVDHQELSHATSGLDHFNVFNGSSTHGTHVSGTVAAEKDNVEMHGVAFNASILAVSTLDGTPSEGDVGFLYAANRDAKVINASWGYDYCSFCPGIEIEIGDSDYNFFKSLLGEDLDALVDNDVLLTVAAGNDAYTDHIGVPAIFAQDADYQGYMIAVASVDEDLERSSFSDYCFQAKEFCIAAPGGLIYSSYPSNSYNTISGTSMAAPHVAGAAAVIRGAWPFLTAPQTMQILFDTADDIGDPGIDDVYGNGLLNLYEAVQAQGQNNFSFGTSVSSAGYDLRYSSMTTSPIFGDAIQKNLLPKVSNAVFFDKYGRDYKANLSSKVKLNQSSVSPSLDNIILSNVSYQNVPLNLGFDGKSRLNFNLADYKNSDVRNITGLKYALIDNSVDPQQQAASNNGFSFTQNDVILPNSSFGFAFNIDEISRTQNKEFGNFGFIMQNNFAANPYQKFMQQSFGYDPNNTRKFNQVFAQHNFFNNKMGVNFSYQSSSDSTQIFGNSGTKQNQVFDFGFSFKSFDDSQFLVTTGTMEEFDSNILNSKSVGAFSAGDSVKTSYVKITSAKELTKDLKLIASFSEGISQINGNSYGLFREFNDVRSRSASVGLVRENLFGGRVGLSYSEPMRVYKGTAKFDAPIARDNAGNVIRYQGTASLAPSGKERDFEMFFSKSLDQNSVLTFNYLLQEEPGNIKDAKDNHLGFVTYRKTF